MHSKYLSQNPQITVVFDHPPSRKLILSTDRDHIRKPQSNKIQICTAQSQWMHLKYNLYSSRIITSYARSLLISSRNIRSHIHKINHHAQLKHVLNKDNLSRYVERENPRRPQSYTNNYSQMENVEIETNILL